jgi:type III restriction enzyme
LPALTLDLPAATPLSGAVAQAVAAGDVSVSTDGERQRLRVVGTVGEALASDLIAAHKGKQREQTAEQIERHNALVAATLAPVNRGESFAPLPRLAYRSSAQGELLLLEREAVFEQVDLNLLAEPASLEGFSMAEQPSATWEVYLDGSRVRIGAAAGAQFGLDGVRGTATEDDLARWLAATLQHPARNVARDIVPSHLRAFIVATLRHLMHERGVPLEQLVRHQHTLAQRLEARIAELRDRAAHAAFRQYVLDERWHLEASARHRFEFGAAYPVPANRRYEGKFRFAKHFYPVVASLKDGGEEWHCAMAIEHHPQVVRWVRNLDSDPVAGFWLPTSFGRFYPDFVAELSDGRLIVIEYKGAQIASMPKEIEKGEVGRLWAARSNGRCLFALVLREREGLGVAQQIDAVLRTSS